jgi:asparagine synthetase B (glutamine-hydrolysing)
LGYLERWKLPVASPNHFVWMPLFARATGGGIGTILDGEGGDEIFDVSGYAIADALMGGRAARAVKLARLASGPAPTRAALMRFGAKGAAPHLAHRLLRPVPAGDFDRFAWKRWDGPRWWCHQAFLLTDMREALDAHGYLRRRSWEAGLESRHPFMHDVDLVEAVLSIPPAPRFHAELDRALLRRGLRGRLPDGVLAVQDKRSFDGLLKGAVQSGDGELLRELVGDPAAEVRAFADAPYPWEESADARPAVLWRAGVVECWLRSLADPGFPARLRERCANAPE